MESVACADAPSCDAIGDYYYAGNVTSLFADTLAAGTLASSQLPLPPDALTGDGAEFSSMACPAEGSCVAVGWYSHSPSSGVVSEQGIIETLSGGPSS
jgi:hypothetical protein